MHQRHQEKLDLVATTLTTLTDFFQKHSVPEDFTFIFDEKSPIIYVTLKYSNDDERNRILLEAGKAFGTDGWKATQVSITDINWKKTIDGVRIDLDGAKTFPMPEPQPVAPKEFPLQLTA